MFGRFLFQRLTPWRGLAYWTILVFTVPAVAVCAYLRLFEGFDAVGIIEFLGGGFLFAGLACYWVLGLLLILVTQGIKRVLKKEPGSLPSDI